LRNNHLIMAVVLALLGAVLAIQGASALDARRSAFPSTSQPRYPLELATGQWSSVCGPARGGRA